jgi:hypothetical protein
MANAAATVLPWKRLPSVSEQMTRSRISRSPAPKADSSRGPACTATARPSPVRVTRSGHGGGMPGAASRPCRPAYSREDHNQLTSRHHRGDGSPAHRAFPHGRTRPPARRSGTSEANPAEPDCAPAGLPRSRHRPHAGQLPGQAQDSINGYWRSESANSRDTSGVNIGVRSRTPANETQTETRTRPRAEHGSCAAGGLR